MASPRKVRANARDTRTTMQKQIANEARLAEIAKGRRVVVITEGHYNNAQNKGLGLCKEGDIIYVAHGQYADDLIKLGLVAEEEALLDEEEFENQIESMPNPDAPKSEPESDETSSDSGEQDLPPDTEAEELAAAEAPEETTATTRVTRAKR